MNKVFFGFSIFIPLFLLDTSAIHAAVLNIAKPDIHVKKWTHLEFTQR